MLIERLIAIIDPSQSILEVEIAFMIRYLFSPSHSCARVNQYGPNSRILIVLILFPTVHLWYWFSLRPMRFLKISISIKQWLWGFPVGIKEWLSSRWKPSLVGLQRMRNGILSTWGWQTIRSSKLIIPIIVSTDIQIIVKYQAWTLYLWANIYYFPLSSLNSQRVFGAEEVSILNKFSCVVVVASTTW